MTISDGLMVIAVLLAPLVAVYVQSHIELMREKNKRKANIFHTLMATRAARVSPEHVQALNRIDIEFYGRKILGFFKYQSGSEKIVVETWKTYLDHLNTPYADEEFKNWLSKGDDFLTDLLYAMAEALGYHFDKVHLKKGVYFPKAHGDQEGFQLFIRDSLVKIFKGEQAIPMKVVSFPVSEEALAKQEAVQSKLIDCLDGKQALKVKLEKEKEI